MSQSRHQPPLEDGTGNPHSAVSRSTFLVHIGLVAASVLGGAGAVFDRLLSPRAALAASRAAASINSTMPVVSKIGLFLGNVTALPPNKALAYKDPKTGDPALVIRLSNGRVVSYDVVCPHQGCSVGYDPGLRALVCPCHGARFDPMRKAAPLAGPVTQPLITLPIRVDAGGNVFALDVAPGPKVNRLHAAPPPSAGDDGNGDDGGDNRKRKSKHGHPHHGDD